MSILLDGVTFVRYQKDREPAPLCFWMSDSFDRLFWADSAMSKDKGDVAGILLMVTIEGILEDCTK